MIEVNEITDERKEKFLKAQEKQKEYSRKYYQTHREEILAKKKERMAAYPNEYKKALREYRYGKGREKYLQAKQTYQQTDKYKAKQHEYYLKRKADPNYKAKCHEYYLQYKERKAKKENEKAN